MHHGEVVLAHALLTVDVVSCARPVVLALQASDADVHGFALGLLLHEADALKLGTLLGAVVLSRTDPASPLV